MRKIIALMVIGLLAVSLGAAVDRHGPMKTGLFEVQIDDVEVKGWQSVTIPGKSVEQDEYREGNEAKHEKKMRGQPSFDDLEMERGVKPGATELHDWIKDIQAGSEEEKQIDWFEAVRAGKADAARKEIAVKLLSEDEETATAYYYVVRRRGEELAGPGDGNGDEQERGTVVVGQIEQGLIDEIRDDDEVTFEREEGRKGMNAFDVRRTDLRAPDEGGKTVGAGKIIVILDLAGGDDDDDGEYRVKVKFPAKAGGGDEDFQEALAELVEAAQTDGDMNKAELIDSIASEADISKRSDREGRKGRDFHELQIPEKGIEKIEMAVEKVKRNN